MFISDKLVYIHLQKTGGSRIREILHQFTGGHNRGPRHITLDRKPAGKLVIGSIRNPFEWYVSLWAFGCQGKGGVLSWLKDDEAWQDVYADSDNPALFQQWLRMVYSPQYVGKMGNGYNTFCLNETVGLMTWRYARLYTENVGTRHCPDFFDYDQFRFYLDHYCLVDMWLQLENLAFTLWNALKVAGYEVNYAALVAPCEKRSNQSEHRPYRNYHTPETIALIEQKERYIMERFEYSE